MQTYSCSRSIRENIPIRRGVFNNSTVRAAGFEQTIGLDMRLRIREIEIAQTGKLLNARTFRINGLMESDGIRSCARYWFDFNVRREANACYDKYQMPSDRDRPEYQKIDKLEPFVLME